MSLEIRTVPARAWKPIGSSRTFLELNRCRPSCPLGVTIFGSGHVLACGKRAQFVRRKKQGQTHPPIVRSSPTCYPFALTILFLRVSRNCGRLALLIPET